MYNLPFSLTNEQRKYLGLTQVDESWELVKFNDKIFLYFDGDIIRKELAFNESFYWEKELNRLTTDGHTMLPPLTTRGKPKKLNYTGLQSCTPESSYFRWDGSSGYITIGNFTTQQTYHTTYGDRNKYKLWGDVQSWISNWIAETSHDDLNEMEQFRTAKRKNVKVKEGDFFVFRIGRREYGFGRILLDIRRIKKDVKSGKIKESHYGLTRIMAQPLMVKVYKKVSSTPKIDLTELSETPAFFTQQIMDNRFFYGEYSIIGNLSLRNDELDFPISIGQIVLNDGAKKIYFQYGMIYITTPLEKYSNFCKSLESKGIHIRSITAYSANAVGANLWVMKDITRMKESMKTNDFLESQAYVYSPMKADKAQNSLDLRHPCNSDIKREIFSYFGLDAEKNYAENYDIYIHSKN